MAIPLTTFDGRRITMKYDLLALNKNKATPSHRTVPVTPLREIVLTAENPDSIAEVYSTTGWIAVQTPDNLITVYASGDYLYIENSGDFKIWSCIAEGNSAPSGDITEIYCSSCGLTNLNLTNATALTQLQCCCNSLTYLDISNNPNMTQLRCHYNLLTSLDISNKPLITDLVLSHNSGITSNNWDTILSTLVINGLPSGYFVIHDTNHGGPDNPPTAAGLSSGATLTAIGWGVYYDND